jgi:hypothetical protein
VFHCHGSLGSDHARFLRGFALAGKRRRYPKALSLPSAAWLPVLVIQSEQRPTLLDPSLTLTRTQCPAIAGNTGNRKPLTHAVYASQCNAQQPLTAHS